MTRARKRVGALLVSTATVALVLTTGCGKPDDAAGNEEGGTPLAAVKIFESQCPLGTVSEAVPSKLVMVDCGFGETPPTLKTPPQAMRFEVDCARMKIQVIGTKYRKPADGFNLTVDGAIALNELYGGPIELSGDSTANTPCVAYSTLDLSGAVSCAARDKPVIDMGAQWNLSKAKRDTVAPSPLRDCKLPASCVIRTTGHFTQCT